ncbi:MAG TPA: hypothetical protein VKB79_22310 [Bryobacteraceae bacterium]|nr:hypothetical protein [Bryobacteraceae bacterium]
MKNVVVIGVAACASAFCQTAGPQFQLLPQDQAQNILNQHLKNLKLLNAPTAPVNGGPVLKLSTAPSACAIPLLNALPAAGNIDYKIRVLRAPATERKGSSVPFTSGAPPFPPCNPRK